MQTALKDIRLRFSAGVILFISIWFLFKKITKSVFKKTETEPKPVQTDRFRFGYFGTKTDFFCLPLFFLVWLGFFLFGSVFRFGSVFPVWLVSFWFFRFQAYQTKLIGFLKILIDLIDFFSLLGFFGYFFSYFLGLINILIFLLTPSFPF
jgi:hypothetical protein